MDPARVSGGDTSSPQAYADNLRRLDREGTHDRAASLATVSDAAVAAMRKHEIDKWDDYALWNACEEVLTEHGWESMKRRREATDLHRAILALRAQVKGGNVELWEVLKEELEAEEELSSEVEGMQLS